VGGLCSAASKKTVFEAERDGVLNQTRSGVTGNRETSRGGDDRHSQFGPVTIRGPI
jgi:hypothetical protein